MWCFFPADDDLVFDGKFGSYFELTVEPWVDRSDNVVGDDKLPVDPEEFFGG